MGAVGLILVLIVVFCGIFGPWITPFDPLKINVPDKFQAPSLTHLMGTDNLGRDVFSRVIAGSRIALTIGISTIAIALVLGSFSDWLRIRAALAGQSADADLRLDLLLPDGGPGAHGGDPSGRQRHHTGSGGDRHPDAGLCTAHPHGDAHHQELGIHPGHRVAWRIEAAHHLPSYPAQRGRHPC